MLSHATPSRPLSSMLLTISQPPKDFRPRLTHDFSPRVPLLKSRVSLQLPRKIDFPANSLRDSEGTEERMTTPHRGLPPPSAMNLPDPRERVAQPPLGQPLGGPLGPMPQPPNQWHGQEESMRNWLAAKAEEDKRKQEEEKTKQEGFRLEQRRIEQSMLRESLQAGVPPAMVPMIYAGIGGANLANVSLDWLQQYAAQLQVAQQQIQQQASPELRREVRLISQAPAAYAQPIQQQILPTQPLEQPPLPPTAPLQTTFSAYQPAASLPGPPSGPRSATHAQLPRLTTNEMHVFQPPPNNPGSAHPLQQSQTTAHEPPASSPSIYFHHWVPPTESKNQPATPANKGGEHGTAQASESEYKESPRKRKAQGGHEKTAPPPAGSAHISPAFSTISSSSRQKGERARTRSNASARGSEGRPESRRGLDPPRSSQTEQYDRERREERRSRESSQQRDPGSGSGRSSRPECSKEKS